MSLNQLTQEEQDAIESCVRYIYNGNQIEDWEFQTRLGVDRREVDKILKSWPQVDDALCDSVASLTINNSVVEILHGIHIPDDRWDVEFSVTRDNLERIYTKWATLHSDQGGIR